MIFDRLNRYIKNTQKKKRGDELVKRVQDVADGYWDVYCDALTWHGRYWIVKVLQEDELGNIELDTKVKVMMRSALLTAPYQFNAIFN